MSRTWFVTSYEWEREREREREREQEWASEREGEIERERERGGMLYNHCLPVLWYNTLLLYSAQHTK